MSSLWTREYSWSPRTHLVVLVFQVFCTGGIVFGWAPLITVLHDEKVYHELCSSEDAGEDEDEICDAQRFRLSLVFTLAAVLVNVTQLAWGWVLDRYGPRKTQFLATFLFLVGWLLFAVSDSKSFDAFIPGYALMGACGPFVQVCGNFIATRFPGKENSVLSVLTAGFQASQLILLSIQILHSNSSVSLRTIMLLLVPMYIVVCLCSLLFMPPSMPSQDDDAGVSRAEDGDDNDKVEKKKGGGGPGELANMRKAYEGQTVHRIRRLKAYYFMVLAHSANAFRANTFPGTIVDQLEHMNDGEESKYTEIISYILSSASVGVLGVSPLVQRYGIVKSYYVVWAVGLVPTLLLLIPNQAIQLVSTIFYVFWPLLLFSVYYMYVGAVFGYNENYGKLVGFGSFTAGALNTLQFLLIWLTFGPLNGSFVVFNIFTIGIGLPVILFPLYVRAEERRLAHKHGSEEELVNITDTHASRATE